MVGRQIETKTKKLHPDIQWSRAHQRINIVLYISPFVHLFYCSISMRNAECVLFDINIKIRLINVEIN